MSAASFAVLAGFTIRVTEHEPKEITSTVLFLSCLPREEEFVERLAMLQPFEKLMHERPNGFLGRCEEIRVDEPRISPRSEGSVDGEIDVVHGLLEAEGRPNLLEEAGPLNVLGSTVNANPNVAGVVHVDDVAHRHSRVALLIFQSFELGPNVI